jgi:predicted nuclease with TOPRIM domain
MNHEDRNEVREMLNDILSGNLQKIEGQYRVIQSQLSSIEIQTTRTNGRVSVLEDKVDQVEKDLLTHPIKCTQGKEISEIKKDLEEYRFFKKYPKVFIGIILICALIAWYGFRQLNNKIDKQGVPVITNSRGQLIPLPDSTHIIWLYNDSLKYVVKRVK